MEEESSQSCALVPLGRATQPVQGESYDKQEWLKELRVLSRFFQTEDRGKYKSLFVFKRENPTFIEECEKEEQKLGQKLFAQQKEMFKFILKTKADVLSTREVVEGIAKGHGNFTYDKLQKQVRDIEQAIKGFKLRSRKEYEKLTDEEAILQRELDLVND